MRPRGTDRVKLVVSLFSAETHLVTEVLGRLRDHFGPMDFLSQELAFDSTDYYEEEFGKGLRRKIASFEQLIEADELAGIKIYTNGIEDDYLSGEKRRINIDPGYMALEKFVLASCKNFSHRIYLGDGVFADLTLMYSGGDFAALPWTYPDYNGERIRAALSHIRTRYALQRGRGLRNNG